MSAALWSLLKDETTSTFIKDQLPALHKYQRDAFQSKNIFVSQHVVSSLSTKQTKIAVEKESGRQQRREPSWKTFFSSVWNFLEGSMNRNFHAHDSSRKNVKRKRRRRRLKGCRVHPSKVYCVSPLYMIYYSVWDYQLLFIISNGIFLYLSRASLNDRKHLIFARLSLITWNHKAFTNEFLLFPL